MAGMNLETKVRERWPGTILVEVKGRLDERTTESFAGILAEHVTPAIHYLTLDLSALEYLNSVCIRQLLLCRKELEIRGGKLLLAGPSPGIRRVIDVVNLVPASDIFDSTAEAEAHLEKAREASSTTIARCLGHANELGRFSP